MKTRNKGMHSAFLVSTLLVLVDAGVPLMRGMEDRGGMAHESLPHPSTAE